eukprot:3375774-Rhodomonas_salina.1
MQGVRDLELAAVAAEVNEGGQSPSVGCGCSQTLSWGLCRGGEGWVFTAYQNEARACDGEDRGEG